jgi:hypothetical protein
MHGCRETGLPSARDGTFERPAAAGAAGRACADEPAGGRFAELLRRLRQAPEEPASPGVPSAAPAEPSQVARLWSATSRESPAAPGPGPPVAGASQTPLADVQAAVGPESAALQFTVDDGFLAGAHMAFLLRGDVLELVVEAPMGEALARVREREDELREALAARGLELERFETESGGRDDAEPDAEDAREAAAGRRARERGGSKGERTG